MSWAAPRTYVTGEVMRARYLNQDLRDSVRAAVGVFVYVQTTETTTSTAYTDLTTVGPLLTVITAGTLTVFWGSRVSSSVASAYAGVGINIEDQNGTAHLVDDAHACFNQTANTSRNKDLMDGFHIATLEPGPASVKMLYRSSSGASTATFLKRWMLVYPVGPE